MVDCPFVSVIVLNYNQKVHLKECFESLEKLNYPKDRYEVIMVDNASSDDSVEYAKENFPWVKILELDKNYGFAEANNRAVQIATGDYIAFLNNDTKVDENWLMELVKYAIEDNNAIYASKMLRYDKKDTIVYCGSKMLAWGMPLAADVYKKDNNIETDSKLTFYADAAGMLMKKKIFLTLGGFDSSYFIYAEDWDLSWRAWVFGYKAIVVPTSKYYHKISSTFGSRSPRYIYLLWRNELCNIVKNAELSTAIKMLLLHGLWSIVAYLLIFCREKKFSLGLPILKAYASFFLRLPDTLKKRKLIQSKRKILDKELYKEGLILSFSDSIKESIGFLRRKG